MKLEYLHHRKWYKPGLSPLRTFTEWVPPNLGAKRSESLKYQVIWYPKWTSPSLALGLVHFDKEAGLGSSSLSSCLRVADLFSIPGFD